MSAKATQYQEEGIKYWLSCKYKQLGVVMVLTIYKNNYSD